MTDEQIIERCKAAGIKWIPPQEDEGDSGAFPGSFDMVSMGEMRALLAESVKDAANAILAKRFHTAVRLGLLDFEAVEQIDSAIAQERGK